MKNFCLLLCLFLCINIASGAEKSDSTRVLFIGNSYTYYNDMPVTLQKLASSLPTAERLNIAFRKFTPGGCTLRKHAANKELLDAIAEGGWDYVVIQEQSSAPARHSSSVAAGTYPYAHLLDSLVMAANPAAHVIFYMTWGHKDGCQPEHDGYPLIDDYEGMQARLATSYVEMAYDNGAWCAPVGLAWRRVRQERPFVSLYTPDRSHPSRTGSYLAANVILSTILQKPYQSSYSDGLDPELCEYIQTVAQQTVLANLRVLNIAR